jgi:acetyltransferase-like isoleucine patch superfamily enzyme
MSPRIAFGNSVFLAKDVWLNIVDYDSRSEAGIIFGDGCSIGRRSVISAKNCICLERDVLLAPSVLLMDHNHEYSDPDLPIREQGTTLGGRIIIGRNCWLGYGAAIVCDKDEIILGRNTIVGAHSVVTKSFPPFSVVVGAPARLVRRFDKGSGTWVKVNDGIGAE